MRRRTFWFIAKTKNNRERYAERNARAVAAHWGIKITTFIPKIELNDRGAEEFLFPGFMFVNTPGQWRFLESTYGVAGVITFGETAGTVPHRVIRKLRAIDKAGRLPKWRKPKSGETVKVTRGPYRDMVGLVQGTPKAKRVCILLDFMSKKVPLILDEKHVMAVPAVA